MTFKVIAEAEATREWNEAVDWYEAQETGVGWRFDDALQAFLQTLKHHPERFGLAARLTHKARLPEPWPYSVYFTINMEYREVKILAVWHGSRNPAELRQRLK
ncbi:MAG TPA: type II toxin-antitoxin system RelE/ParE family toxin [Verrucomicrobiae bacterium]|nr:type II toxin-antitoxin system RelE/ParE family toxin [Verrucomicrobiae bacterium]